MKIAFISPQSRFLRSELILKEFMEHHNIRYHEFKGRLNVEEAKSLFKWADVVWFEFFESHVLLGLTLCKKPMVLRVHRGDVYDPRLAKLDMSKIDLLLTSYKYDFHNNLFMEYCKVPPKDSKVIPVGVDINTFKLINRKFEKPYWMCILGTIIPRKRIYSLIQMFADLPNYWHLNIVGYAWQKLREYLIACEQLVKILKLQDRVKFVGKIEYDKLPEFLSKQHIIVSNSYEEGLHKAVLEGMATGCYPLINNWYGANGNYPLEYIFSTPKGFSEMVREWEDSSFKAMLSLNARKYVADNYDAKVNVKKVREAVEELVK